jgi:hypothetical protein
MKLAVVSTSVNWGTRDLGKRCVGLRGMVNWYLEIRVGSLGSRFNGASTECSN